MTEILHADNELSDQTAQMRMLICPRLVHMSEGTFSHYFI